MRLTAIISLLALAACSSPEQEAREDAAAQEDAIVAAQTGQDYGAEGPREQAAEKLGDAYDPRVDEVANSANSPVKADLPAEVPDPTGQ
jgi:uncharacterized membrane protein